MYVMRNKNLHSLLVIDIYFTLFTFLISIQSFRSYVLKYLITIKVFNVKRKPIMYPVDFQFFYNNEIGTDVKNQKQ
jgi:hypothetical protein